MLKPPRGGNPSSRTPHKVVYAADNSLNTSSLLQKDLGEVVA